MLLLLHNAFLVSCSYTTNTLGLATFQPHLWLTRSAGFLLTDRESIDWSLVERHEIVLVIVITHLHNQSFPSVGFVCTILEFWSIPRLNVVISYLCKKMWPKLCQHHALAGWRRFSGLEVEAAERKMCLPHILHPNLVTHFTHPRSCFLWRQC